MPGVATSGGLRVRPVARWGVANVQKSWLLLNPLYPWLAHRRGQLAAPPDPLPDRRLWLCKLRRCGAVHSDDPASTLAAPGRQGMLRQSSA